MSSIFLEERVGERCLIVGNKAAPIDNVFNFLIPEEQNFVMKLSIVWDDERNTSNRTKTMVNAIMHSIKSYFNPIEHLLEDTEVDKSLNISFPLNSLALKQLMKNLRHWKMTQKV